MQAPKVWPQSRRGTEQRLPGSDSWSAPLRVALPRAAQPRDLLVGLLLVEQVVADQRGALGRPAGPDQRAAQLPGAAGDRVALRAVAGTDADDAHAGAAAAEGAGFHHGG